MKRMLVFHRTDRWYFGDFLRHASWLGWAAEMLPDARVDLATHASYLPLYGDGRFGAMLDVAALVPGDLAGYDLVVEPTSFPAVGPAPAWARRWLRTWDRGWELHAYGRVVAHGTKDELNYFRAAHPASIGLPAPDQGGWRGTEVVLTGDELAEASRLLTGACPGDSPVVVVNPTASNPFTRETSTEKEVDNTLTVAEHVAVARAIATALPDHALVVAAPVKPGDSRNERVAREVAAALGGTPVVTSLRGFAAVLADSRVCSTIGGGTGSNTHLAALVGSAGVWSLSIERAADAVMEENWSRPDAFQMGSFRWRNPSPRTAVHTMSWTHDPGSVARAADSFVTHHLLAHGDEEALFGQRRSEAVARSEAAVTGPDARLGQVLAAWMTPEARNHLADFGDELAYLRARFPRTNGGCGDDDPLASLAAVGVGTGVDDPAATVLAQRLFRDSNLHKLVRLLTLVGPASALSR